MYVYIESLGCARNQVDSENMAARFRAAGWELLEDPAEADVIVVNTCSFIEAAADESIDTILALSEYKRTGNCKRLIVTGCLPQRYGLETARVLPEVDLFLGTGAYDRIYDRIVAVMGGQASPGACLLPDPDSIDPAVVVRREALGKPAVYLKIAEGCSRHCTYCIIPRLRGRQKSRPMATILSEAHHLIAQGARELTLVAQETTAYGMDAPAARKAAVPGSSNKKGTISLANLLGELAALDSSVWIRFLYGHPESFSDALLETVARWPNLVPYFDIPVQHAAGGLLRRMGRRYAADDLISLFGRIRRAVPDAALRTTVLVGFPGESETDFELLKSLVRQVRFDHLGVFAYSDAEDLPSHRLPEHVPARLAQRRRDELMRLQQGISARNLSRFKDKRLAVLVETSAGEGTWVGRTMHQAPEVDGTTVVRSPRLLSPGDFVQVRIVDTMDYDLIGETD